MLDSNPTISLWDMRCYMPFPASSQPPLVQQEPLTPAQLYQSLSNLVVRFVASLTTNGTGCLAQIWAPSVADDGGVILSTQGIPYSCTGPDLLALYRCISCRFKFNTDVTKPSEMGVVGRVFASGEPEFSHNVQTYDKSVYLRVQDAQRCRIHSTMLLPLYMNPQRDHPFAVFEVCQSEKNVMFPSLVDLLQRCLEAANFYTVDVEKHSMGVGLRCWPTNQDYNNGKDCSASIATYANEAPGGPDAEVHCSADSLHKGGLAAAAAAESESPQEEPNHPIPPQVKAEKSADSEEMRGMTVAAFSSAPSSSSPQPIRHPTGSPPAIFSPFQSQQQQQLQLPSAQQAAMMELSGHSGPPSMHQHPDKFGPDVSVTNPGPARLVSIGNRLQLDLEPQGHARHFQPRMSDPGLLDSGRQGSGGLSSDRCQLRRGSGALSNDDLGPQKRQCLPQPSMDFKHHPYHSLHTQDMGMLNHSLEVLPWDGGALPGGLPFDDDDDMRMVLDSNGQDVNNRVGGGAGKRLSLPELQAQFGVGLREAAANLRICPTTLKRACRRHGITRWPRRQLARLNREGSSRSDGSGETLRTEWGPPGGPSSGGQPAMPTSSGDAAAMTTRARAKAQQLPPGAVHDMPLSQGCTISPLALTPLDFNPDLPPQSFYLSVGHHSSDGLLDMLQPLSPHMSAPSAAPQEAPLLHPDEMLW